MVMSILLLLRLVTHIYILVDDYLFFWLEFKLILLLLLFFVSLLLPCFSVTSCDQPFQFQVRLRQEYLNIAKFEPEHGLDPMLDLVLVGSEWQFRIQSRASNWQEKLVVTSTRSVEQDALSPTEVISFQVGNFLL